MMRNFTLASSKARELFALWARNRRGVAAVEFAFILPLMLLIYLGSAEVTQALMASRNATLVARTLADLIAQQANGVNVTDTELSQAFSAANAVMAPFSTASLKMTITSVNIVPSSGTGSSGGFVAQPEWSAAAASPSNGPLRPCTNLTAAPDAAAPTPITLPQDLYSKGSLIVADVSFTYTPPFGANFFKSVGLPAGITYSHSAYMRPRAWTSPTPYIAYTPGSRATSCSSWS